MADRPLLCGIDAGTSRIRAVVFDTDGRLVAEAAEPTPTRRLGPGQAEHDPEALWQTLAGVLRRATGGVERPDRIRGLAIASMGEAGVLLDGESRPLAPVIAWYDTRTAPQLERLLGQVGFGRLHATTGLCPDPTFTLLKLLWLKDTAPEAFARGRAWLHVSDYLAWRLCGGRATDFSLASRTMALDIAAGRWCGELLEEAGVGRTLFQELAPAGTRIGGVTAEAARATGLPEGAAVGVAGHDHVCGALAVGADRPGVLFDSMGTAEALTLIIGRPSRDPEMGVAGLNQGMIHTGSPVFYVFGGLPTSAACVEWFRESQAPGVDHATLIAEAETVPLGCDGTVFLPHLRIGSPPYPDPVSRGAFLGISDRTTRAALYRAVLEGLALDSANILDTMQRLLQVPAPTRAIAIGGSSRNRLLMQLKASLFGRTIELASSAESTSLGAAMLGGLASETFPNLDTARAAMMPAFHGVGPDRGWPAAERDAVLARYARIYRTVRGVATA
jgi:xylulokinase